MENRIKACQFDLFADRTSAKTMHTSRAISLSAFRNTRLIRKAMSTGS